MARRSSDWHISGWPAYVLAPIVFPVAIIVSLLTSKKTRDRTPAEVAGYLYDFIGGTGGQWDWDDFTSIPITDPKLEAIRLEAELVQLPVDEAGLMKLRELRDRVYTIMKQRQYSD
jgi:hypothetical protein